MTQTLEKVIEQIHKDVEYDSKMLTYYEEGTKDYLFHLGRVDALTSVRWKLEQIIKCSEAVK